MNDRRPPEALTAQEWKLVHHNYVRGAEVLDELVRLLAAHIEEGGCTGPWCEPPEFAQVMNRLTSGQQQIVAHQAMYRLAMLEAGLNPKDIG